MNKDIIVEVRYFFISYFSGFFLILAYDVFRILRRLIAHNAIIIAIQDICYWFCSALFLFAIMYRFNNGIIRTFAIAGILLGMIVYQYIFSNMIIKWVTRFIRFLFAPAVFVYKQIKRFCMFVYKRLKKLWCFYKIKENKLKTWYIIKRDIRKNKRQSLRLKKKEAKINEKKQRKAKKSDKGETAAGKKGASKKRATLDKSVKTRKKSEEKIQREDIGVPTAKKAEEVKKSTITRSTITQKSINRNF